MSERDEEKNTVKTVSENGPGQDAAKEYGRKVSESKVETFHIIMPRDLISSWTARKNVMKDAALRKAAQEAAEKG